MINLSVVDIDNITHFCWETFVILSTAIRRRFKEELAVIVWASRLPSSGNVASVGTVCVVDGKKSTVII